VVADGEHAVRGADVGAETDARRLRFGVSTGGFGGAEGRLEEDEEEEEQAAYDSCPSSQLLVVMA